MLLRRRVVDIIIIMIHRFQGIKLEYAMIDNLKIVTVVY